MMKNKKQKFLIVILVIIGIQGMAQKPGSYKIVADIKDAKNIVYLYKEGIRSGVISDTTRAINGHFEFKGNTQDIEYATIEVETGAKFNRFIFLFLESGNIVINANRAEDALPFGTFDNNLLNKFESNQSMRDSMRFIAPYFDKINGIHEELFNIRKQSNPDQTRITVLTDSASKVQTKIDQFRHWRENEVAKYVLEHPDTYFVPAYGEYLDSMAMIKAYDNLNPTIQASKLGQKLLAEIKGSKQLQEGTVAPTFTTKDINDKTISLADFKGKFVLLDFWATWCGPCREGNPELIKIYNKYHDKGLEIIGISDDNKNIEGWKKAVKLDKIGIWHHTLRIINPINNGKPIDITELYNVHSYPTQYLINKEGKVVATVELKDLENTLKQLMP